MARRTVSPSASFLNSRGWRLLLATTALALAGSVLQTAMAMPGGGPGHAGMGGGLGLMAGGRGAERLLDSVGASAEQKAQLRQIMEAARNELKPLHDSQRKLREQMHELFAQPTVDARAVEALRQQMASGHEQAGKRMTQALLDASRVLSPDQRKQLAERMRQRQTMMQRHRSERESLEGAPRRP